MSRGRFISFEGSEGCGKSTQLNLLAERLRKSALIVRTLREPGGTALGEELRNLLKHHPAGRGMAPQAELLLMSASRAQLVQEIVRPALAAGEIVLCDRFLDSTIAYQGYGRGLDLGQVRSAVDLAVGETRPDLTLLLAVPRTIAGERMKKRQSGRPANDRFEEEDESFFARVDAGYRDIAALDPVRIRTIDATGEIPVVAAEIWRVVAPFLGLSSKG
jgi:dTMP kinase